MRLRDVVVSLLVVVGMCAVIRSVRAGDEKSEIKAARKALLAKAQDSEPVHIKSGLAIVVTAKGPSEVKELHDAASSYETRRAKADKGINCNEEIAKTNSGLLVLDTAQSPAVVKDVQEQNACDWCVCSNGTVKPACKGCC